MKLNKTHIDQRIGRKWKVFFCLDIECHLWESNRNIWESKSSFPFIMHLSKNTILNIYWNSIWDDGVFQALKAVLLYVESVLMDKVVVRKSFLWIQFLNKLRAQKNVWIRGQTTTPIATVTIALPGSFSQFITGYT